MLSYIYRLVHDFEKEHGLPPNLLYLNQAHMSVLREQLGPAKRLDDVVGLLGMELIITQEATHPHVAWVQAGWQRKAV
jgi:hypothetical protein